MADSPYGNNEPSTRGPVVCNFTARSGDAQLRFQPVMQGGRIVSYYAIVTEIHGGGKDKIAECNITIEQAQNLNIAQLNGCVIE